MWFAFVREQTGSYALAVYLSCAGTLVAGCATLGVACTSARLGESEHAAAARGVSPATAILQPPDEAGSTGKQYGTF